MAGARDMRNETVDGSTAKDVKDTKMLDVTARESSMIRDDNNEQKQYTTSGGKMSSGARGRGGN